MPPPDTGLERTAELLRVLGHEVRLRLLRALTAGERSVGEIEAATGIGQPALSQQLGVLRKAGLVATRREVKQIFYRIDRDSLAETDALIAELRGAGPAPAPAPTAAERFRAGGGAAMFARVG